MSNASSKKVNKGVIYGSSFDRRPSSPKIHLLAHNIKIQNFPAQCLPNIKDGLAKRIKNIWVYMLTGQLPYNRDHLKKAYDHIISIIMSVDMNCNTTIDTLISNNNRFKKQWGWFKTHNDKIFTINHPYDMIEIIDFIPHLDGELLAEKYSLELYCYTIINNYISMIKDDADSNSLMKKKFSFSEESSHYFHDGYKLEAMLANVDSADEKKSIVKIIYENYFHAKWYYYFSVLAREKIGNEGKNFMSAYHAMLFMAKVDDFGILHNAPKRRYLPRKQEIKFYIRRDTSLRLRSDSDKKFEEKLQDIVKSLPSY